MILKKLSRQCDTQNRLARLGVLLSCNYKVEFIDHLGIDKKKEIPIFKNKDFGYFVQTMPFSLGTLESESYNVGSYQANYYLRSTSGELELTILESGSADIIKSFNAIKKLILNTDGTLNEPAKSAFTIKLSFINHKNDTTVFSKAWVVGYLSLSSDSDASGYNEVKKHSLTLIKLMPSELFK